MKTRELIETVAITALIAVVSLASVKAGYIFVEFGSKNIPNKE